MTMRREPRMLLVALVSVCAGALAGEAMQLDDAIAELKAYDYGKPGKVLRALERMIGQATNDPQSKAKMAERLAAILSDAQTSEAAKLYACQQLHWVGTDAQVALLAKMLDDPKTTEMARGALQGIGTGSARASLRAAMEKAQGDAQIGLINSLGLLSDEKSVGILAKLGNTADAKLGIAAAKALAHIGSTAAATALMEMGKTAGFIEARAAAKGPPPTEFLDALLGCAERLVAGKDTAAAADIYQRLWGAGNPKPVRIAALRGLVKARQAEALPTVLDAMKSDDPDLHAAAMGLLRQVPGPAATAALAELVGKLKGAALASLVEALGLRGDKTALNAVLPLLDHEDNGIRAAAITALATLGDAALVERVAQIAGTDGGPAKAAQACLSRLSGQGVDAAVLAAVDKVPPASRAALIRAATDRRISDGTATLLKATGDDNEAVRLAAAEAMAVIGAAPQCYPRLMDLLLNGTVPPEPAEKAALAVANRLTDPQARVGPVLAALAAAKPAAKPSFIRILRGLSGADALSAVRAALADGDAGVRDAAVRALADWADEAPADDLLKLVKEAPENTHRVLALRGYLRMARSAKGGPTEQLRMLQQVAQVATTPEARKLLLGGLGDIPEVGALQVAGAMLSDAAVQAEAKVAVLKIAGGIARTNQAAAREAVERLAATANDAALTEQLRAAIEAANRPEVGEQEALKPDPKRSEELKKALAKRAPKGFSLACYLDCGADMADGAKGGPVLKAGEGKAYFFPEADRAAHYRFGTVWYGGEVPFAATGLDAKKAYQIGFSWWDHDGGGRVESVWLAPGKGGEFKEALKATKLPDFKNNQEMPAEFVIAVPPNLYADGSLRIAFRPHAGPNAVVSEIWVWEGGEGSAKDVPMPTMDTPKEQPKETKPAAAAPVEIKRGKAEPGRATKILVVTGIDYPGHKWRETYPVVVADLTEDKRLLVDVAESLEILCSAEINDYAALIIHFMNWEKPDPGEKARANLKAFVEGGKGIVLTHFACGAFQDGGNPWPEFPKLAGRGWDRKLRGHDPYGKFQVRMTDVKHAITEGLQPFEVTDELYTCLGGDTPISVLAVATSKVDKKEYPMAFVLDYGKGRVFHTVLGHDAQVWKTAGAAELLRRGTAWAAGIAPVAK